jgi:hypothetical protein
MLSFRAGVICPVHFQFSGFISAASSVTKAVRDKSCTVSTIGPRPRIWCSTGTGLFSHGEAGPAPPSSTSTSR